MKSRLESITKSLNVAASTSAEKEKESMQYTTGIPNEVIASFLDASEETKERGLLTGIPSAEKSKGKLPAKQTSLPTYTQAAQDQKDMRPTALHLAAMCGDIHAIETLLNAGVPMETQDGLGETALHKAVRGGHLKVQKCFWKPKYQLRLRI